MSNSKRPLYFLLMASFLNIGLDLLCTIIVFKMGVFGAGFTRCSARPWRTLATWYIAGIALSCAGPKKENKP